MRIRHKQQNGATSIQHKMGRLVTMFSSLTAAILVAALLLVVLYNSHYASLMYNVTTASEFNQDFKNNIDLRMYYYVIESQYSEGLPIDEVEDAQALARDLLNTTTLKESRLAITSVLDLCENLEEKIYQIQDTENYDERLLQLENNIYVLTSLIQEFMYTYLYYESAQLNTIQQQISRRLVAMIVIIVAIIILLIVIFTRYSVRLSRSITQPVVNLCARVEDISAGDLTVREPIHSEEYELNTLSQVVEQMVGRLNQLMQETTQKQESLRRTELALIQAQINPHFLYNTMDTIIWLIEAEKTDDAVEMVSNLSAFFRHSLSKGRDVISLWEEESHVCSYLQIQQVRYKDIMCYTVNLEPAVKDAILPKLTLQPLVENALYHGIKLKRGMGHIYVTGRLEGEDILLQVTDDGVGMSPQRLEQLRSAMEHEERVGFGLSTVHERIRLFFGPPYGLSISSREGVGTTVSVLIPHQRRKEETKL